MSDEVIEWHVGDVVAKCRVTQKMTRAQLAKLATVSVECVMTIERGQGYRSTNLEKIAKVFGLRAADLIKDIPRDTRLPHAEGMTFVTEDVEEKKIS